MKINRPFKSIPLQVMMGPLMAILPLFGVYVLVHGHYSPGGGFQAGIVVAAFLIMPLLVYGKKRWRQVPIFSQEAAAAMTSLGVLIFAGVGVIPMIMGSYFMDYSALPILWWRGDMDEVTMEAMRRYYGILWIEVGVTLAVCGGILTIYYILYDIFGESEV